MINVLSHIPPVIVLALGVIAGWWLSGFFTEASAQAKTNRQAWRAAKAKVYVEMRAARKLHGQRVRQLRAEARAEKKLKQLRDRNEDP